MMLRLVLLLFALLSLPDLAGAVTRYVDVTLVSTCSGPTYSIAARACTGADGTGYKTVAEGIRALVAGDHLYIRGGGYTEASVYGNVATDTYGAGATSWATASTISNYPGETVTITSAGFNMDHTVSTGGVAYLIWQGDSRSRFIVQGAASGVGGGVGMRVYNAANHIRFQTMTVRNFGQDGIGGGSASCPSNKPDSIEIIDTEVSGNGDSTNTEHGVYFSCSNNLLIDGSWALGNQGYGWHIYSSVTGAHTNVTIRNTLVMGRKSGATGTAYGMVIATGSGNKAYNNIVIGQGAYPVKLTGCMQLYGPATSPLLYHNTCYDVTVGVEVGDSGVSGAEIKNNIFNTLSTAVSDFGTGTVRSTNFCPSAATGCSVTGDPLFLNPGTDFSLQSGSAARDAGADLSAVVGTDYIGVVRPQSIAPDQGAYEYPDPSGRFTIPNVSDAFHAAQSQIDSMDLAILVSSQIGTGVVAGCAVSAQSTPDMTLAVSAGTVRVGSVTVAVSAGSVIITPAHATNPRFDLVAVNASGGKVVIAGTAAASPVFPRIPTDSVAVLAAVYVPASDTAIASNQITDKRVLLPLIDTAEIDFGTAGSWTAKTTVTAPSVTVASRILVTQSGLAATSRQADENEMDALVCSATPASGAYTLQCTNPRSLTHGKFKVHVEVY